jgi:protein SCO1/2
MESASSRRATDPLRSLVRVFALLAAALWVAAPAGAEEPDYAAGGRVGITERLGETVPEGLVFRDEEGQPVELRSLITRPTVLTLVYFRCPNICSPLMHEVAHTVDEVDLVPGVDFDLVTVSFDDREGPDLARAAKGNLLADMEKKVDPRAWRFLTGEGKSIRALADAVGFGFKREEQDFVHAGTVVFLTKDGKIVRYLGGLAMLPFDMKMAINDAAEGTPRTLMQKVQKICYAYDPVGRKYVFQVNKIILIVSLTGLALFLAFLFLRRRSGRKAADEATAGGHA